MKIEAKRPLEGRRLLVAICGSIAAVKTPLLVSALVKAGAEVKCLLTPSAAHLVSPLSLSCLSRNRCYQDEDQWNKDETRPLHISLSEWADLIVIAPLTASTLSRWVQGLGEGLLASLLLASERPVVAAAAMNTAMWSNQAVQRNWQELRKNPRVLCLSPESGLLACDRIGEGRIANPELIELAIQSALLQADDNGKIKRDWAEKRLLVSAGPTLEALDPARLFTNRSSGLMGVLLAQAARLRGAKVDLVNGPLRVPHAWLEGLSTHPIENSEEMQIVLTKLQPEVDVIAMAAAITDLRKTNGAATQKLDKESFKNSFSQKLELVPDLLSHIALLKKPKQILLGFAALTGEDSQIIQAGESKRLKKGCDLLFANPIDRPDQGFASYNNGGFLLGEGGVVKKFAITTKLALAHQLLDSVLKIQTPLKNKS